MNQSRLGDELSQVDVPDSRAAEERTVAAATAIARERAGSRSAEASAEPHALPARRRFATPRAWRILALASACAACAVLGLGLLRGGGEDVTEPSSLNAFAALAAEQPSGGVQRIDSEVGLTAGVDVTYRVESWFTGEQGFERWTATKADGTTALDESRFIDARTGRACVLDVESGSVRCFKPSSGTSDSPLLPETPDLPTDPERLREALAGVSPPFKPLFGAFGLASGVGDDGFQAGPRSDRHAFVVASYLLWHPLSSPELRSALFEVIGELDGVELTTGASDRAGRDAVEVSMAGGRGGFSYELFLDPKTSYLLEARVLDSEGREVGYEQFSRDSVDSFPADADALAEDAAGTD